MTEEKDRAGTKPSETVVPVPDGPDHGYIGTVRDDTPNEDYTAVGVAKAAERENREASERETSDDDSQPAKPVRQPTRRTTSP